VERDRVTYVIAVGVVMVLRSIALWPETCLTY